MIINAQRRLTTHSGNCWKLCLS